MWHGWLDRNIAPRNSITYADSVRATMGEEADEVLRLFMVPGMQHCQGGSGFTQFDALAALERGEAPEPAGRRAARHGGHATGLCLSGPGEAHAKARQPRPVGSASDRAVLKAQARRRARPTDAKWTGWGEGPPPGTLA